MYRLVVSEHILRITLTDYWLHACPPLDVTLFVTSTPISFHVYSHTDTKIRENQCHNYVQLEGARKQIRAIISKILKFLHSFAHFSAN